MNIQRETVKSWEAQVAMARNALADAQAVAPIAGIVARQHARTGERSLSTPPLHAGESAADGTAGDGAGADIGAVQLGASGPFHRRRLRGKSFAGRVERINPTAEPGSRTVTVYIAVPNPDLLLRGQLCLGALDLVASAPRPTAAVRHPQRERTEFRLADTGRQAGPPRGRAGTPR
jgi:multidrug efflux pump subunit AcrA (membrane-fusion protein)